MTPKSWPKRLQYTRASYTSEIAYGIFQQYYLSSPNPEDFHKTSQVIEGKCVHPHVQIQKIKPPHPLAKAKTLKGYVNYGVFAKEKIEAGAEIGEYVGEICITHKGFSEYKWTIVLPSISLEIDAQYVANELALINDYRGVSLSQNVKMGEIIHKGYVYFGYIACCDIHKGEELLVDYGDVFWNSGRITPASKEKKQ